MFSAAAAATEAPNASPRPSSTSSAAAGAGAAAPTAVPPPMTNEEIFAHQLDLHKKIQEQMQQQLQLQKEMSLHMNQQKTQQQQPPPPPPPVQPPSPPLHPLQQQRQSLSAVFAKVEPDLGDNVFDMLDDLIMIPSGAVAPERNSLSKQTIEMNNDESSSGRDSLADILESLDMDLEDFEMNLENSHKYSFAGTESSQTTTDESRDSFDDDFDDLDDDLDLDFDGDMEDHGIDDDDEHAQAGAGVFDVATSDAMQPEDFLDMRRSSFDMVASISGSTSSISQSPNGNMCTLIWEGGLLGLRLRLSQSRMLPAVSKLTGRSSIFGIHLVEMGDLLMQIGSRMTRDMEFMDAINYLKDVEKPCKLVFRRPNADPMAVKTVQPQVKSDIAMKLAQKFEELANAENEKSPQTPIVKMEAKYEVKWLDGPLGISLIASKDVPYPLVTRITGKNRSPQVQDVQPGHYLVQIGTYNTADGNFNTAIKFLQKVSKPVSLFFCPGNKKMSVRPEVSVDEYDHIWEKKQALCFTVKPDEAGRMVVADLGSAKSIKVKAKGGPNLAAFVNPGDVLEWINDDHTKDLTFHESLLKLRTAKRPLIIRFKKPSPFTEPPAPPTPALPTPAPIPEIRAPPAPSSNSESSPSSTSSKTLGRNFNPLKKIAALSSYSKENSINNANARNNELKKSPQSTPDSIQSKKAIFGGSEVEVKRVTHESNLNPLIPKSSGYLNNTPAAVTSSSSTSGPVSDASPASNGEGNNFGEPRREVPPTKLLNIELLNGIRKNAMVKTSSDPSVATNNEKVAAHAPLKPLTLETRHSGAKHVVEEPVPVNKPVNKSENYHSSPLPTTYTGEEGEIYEVVWPEGTALGLTLRVHPTTRFPVVARVTGTSNLKNIEHVSPGDILFAANGMDIVPQAKFKQTLDNLSKLPKPAHLRFRRSQPITLPQAPRAEDSTDKLLPRGPHLKMETEYEIVWRENANLGLVFSSVADVPKVTKVDIESGGLIISRVSVGDVLTWIGPLDIHDSSFHQSMATLRAVKRPVVLRFKRGHP